MRKSVDLIIDMDGVWVDTPRGFNRRLAQLYPAITPVPYEQMIEYNCELLYPEHQRERVRSVWLSDGLFASFDLIPGAIEAIHELASLANITIATTPTEESRTCLQDKQDDVRKHLGREWVSRLIFTFDKTQIQGDILVDDKPEIIGRFKPTWEHVLYTQPYNLKVQGKRRLTWQEDYRKILGL